MEISPPRPLRTEDLPSIEVWFDDPATQRWLGGREWPRGLLQLAGEADRFALLFDNVSDPVALLDLERDGDSAAIAIVVAPTRREEGIALSVLQLLFSLPATKHVVEIVGEVELGNTASERLLHAARFVFDARTQEGFDRYVLRRSTDPAR